MQTIVYIILGIIVAAFLVFLFKLLMIGLAIWGVYKTAKYVQTEAKDIPDEAKIIHAQIKDGKVVKPMLKFAWRRLWRFWDIR